MTRSRKFGTHNSEAFSLRTLVALQEFGKLGSLKNFAAPRLNLHCADITANDNGSSDPCTD